LYQNPTENVWSEYHQSNLPSNESNFLEADEKKDNTILYSLSQGGEKTLLKFNIYFII